jgi:hypothetical protein
VTNGSSDVNKDTCHELTHLLESENGVELMTVCFNMMQQHPEIEVLDEVSTPMSEKYPNVYKLLKTLCYG